MGERAFTDRESGTYGGLMLSLRRYRDRLEPHPGYKLNRKPREVDCLIIDRIGADAEPMDNDIARIFRRHNIVELKNPAEAEGEYVATVVKYGFYDDGDRVLVAML